MPMSMDPTTSCARPCLTPFPTESARCLSIPKHSHCPIGDKIGASSPEGFVPRDSGCCGQPALEQGEGSSSGERSLGETVLYVIPMTVMKSGLLAKPLTKLNLCSIISLDHCIPYSFIHPGSCATDRRERMYTIATSGAGRSHAPHASSQCQRDRGNCGNRVGAA